MKINQIKNSIITDASNIQNNSLFENFYIKNQEDSTIQIFFESKREYDAIVSKMTAENYLLVDNGNTYKITGDFAEKVIDG